MKKTHSFLKLFLKFLFLAQRIVELEKENLALKQKLKKWDEVVNFIPRMAD